MLFLLIGLCSGFLLGWLFFRLQMMRRRPGDDPDRRIEAAVAREKIVDLESRLEKAQQASEEINLDRINLTSRLAQKNAELVNLQEKLDTQKQELESIRERFTTEFRNLANDILEEKSKKFTEQNKTQLDQLLKPLGDRIRDFEAKVEKVYHQESKERFSLKEEVKRLAELNQTVSREAQNLTRALKGQVKTQGTWGEMILESILEKSGLEKNREYYVQPGFVSTNGRRLQPDVVISYPGKKNVVIDAKVSLVAYERYVSAEDQESKQLAMREHLTSVKKHIDELAAKNYQHLYKLNSLDFVMLFMPVEPAFMAALQNDGQLWSYAYERGILMIGPTNLIAALKMVASLWQQEYQNRNVLEIADQSGRLYDKFVGFAEDLQALGQKLHAAGECYDRSLNKLSTGRGNLVSRVEKIRKLGARATKELPDVLKENYDDE